MRRVIYFLGANRRLVTLCITLLLSLSLYLMGDGKKEHVARAVTTAVFNTGRFTFSWGIYLFDLWHENKRLRQENLEYAHAAQSNRLAAQENEHLRQMLGFRERYAFDMIPAMVIGQDVDRVVNALIIDRGSRDGIREYMAVVTENGLIGRIFEVYPNAASIQLLTDTNSRISAMIEGDTPVKGIIRWEGGSNLRMYTLEHVSNLRPGQRVYTTGVGGTYPEGLLIGEIIESGDEDARLYDSVLVQPAVNYSHAHEVFVINGTGRADIWDDGDGDGYFRRPELQ